MDKDGLPIPTNRGRQGSREVAMSAGAATPLQSTALASQPPGWLDVQAYPFAHHWAPLRRGRMHYLDEGRGQPVLFVHGTPTWSFEWRHLVSGLRQTHRCVAPDQLGFGLSERPQ